MQSSTVRVQRIGLQARPQPQRCTAARIVKVRAEDKNPVEKIGDKIKETGEKFAEAQKLPHPEGDELTKDGAFYTVKNDNKLEKDVDMRAGKVTDGGKASPDTPKTK